MIQQSLAPLLLCVAATHAKSIVTSGSSSFGGPLIAYYNVYSEYKTKGYGLNISSIAPVANHLDAIIYGPFRFDDETFAVELDPIVDYERAFSELADLKSKSSISTLISVGGDKFPSSAWSKMANDYQTRQAFINSVSGMISNRNLDGVEISWVFPCAGARTIYITQDPYTPEGFAEVADTGIHEGHSCDEEINNLGNFTSELRASLGEDKIIAFALTSSASNYNNNAIARVTSYVDHFMLKSYGYHVASDPYGTSSTVTAPFQPVDGDGGSATSTLTSFMALSGFDAAKSFLVMPGFGQAYSFTPDRGSDWKQFGDAATKSGCMGPYADTYSSYISDATHECGQMSYKEILIRYNEENTESKAIVQDERSKAELTYLFSKSLFVTFSGTNTAKDMHSLANSNRMGGLALDSIDMDSFAVTDTKDFLLTTELCKLIRGETSDRCQLATTTTPAPPAPGQGCPADHHEGTYCVNQSAFLICPNNVTEGCPPGTVCKQNSSTNIICDWPDQLHRIAAYASKQKNDLVKDLWGFVKSVF